MTCKMSFCLILLSFPFVVRNICGQIINIQHVQVFFESWSLLVYVSFYLSHALNMRNVEMASCLFELKGLTITAFITCPVQVYLEYNILVTGFFTCINLNFIYWNNRYGFFIILVNLNIKECSFMYSFSYF